MVRGVILVVACVSAGLLGFLAFRLVMRRREVARRRAAVGAGGDRDSWVDDLGVSGVERAVLSYLGDLDRRLSHRVTGSVVPKRVRDHMGVRDANLRLMKHAGITDNVGLGTVREAQVRLGFACGAIGAVLGACLSNELAFLLGIGGLVVGARTPMRVVRRTAAERSLSCRRELPEFLEVVSLGLRSGLTFDRSFQLYATHFETGFARSCGVAQQKWTMGLVGREEALRELSDSYDSESLCRVVDVIVRSMRMGTSLASELEKAASDAQAEHQAARQEEVAKAPIRMMIPTATLILPAMLLLVLGPVLLELMEGF